jgi:hypothetical protein
MVSQMDNYQKKDKEIASLKRLALQIADRLYLAAEVLSIKAERKDKRK